MRNINIERLDKAELDTWLEGLFGDQIKKLEDSEMLFGFEPWESDNTDDFDCHIGNFQIDILGSTKKKELDLSIPLNYGQCAMLRDYLDALLENHRQFHQKLGTE